MSSTMIPQGTASEAPAALPLSSSDRALLARRLEAASPRIVTRWYETQFAGALIERYGVVGVESRETMEAGFLVPLLNLLLAYLRTGERRYREVYLDERLRYAPHQADPAVLAEFFQTVLPADEAALYDGLGDAALVAQLAPELEALHRPLQRPRTGDRLRLLAVGDCLLNEVRVFLPSRAHEAGIGLDMRCLYFSGLVGRSIGTEQVLRFVAESSPHLISFSFLTYEGLPPWTALLREADGLSPSEIQPRVDALVGSIREFLNTIRAQTDATFLVHNASGLPLTRWRRLLPVLPPLSTGRQRVIATMNSALAELCEHTPNTLLLDEHGVALRHGHRAAAEEVIPAEISRGAAFHTARFGEYLAADYDEVLRSYRDLHKAKVLLVDFDNTLWDGVMADGPVVQHHDRQKLLRTLKDAGMLLVALSKNDPANIRWDEMTLKPEDFVLLKISWGLKAEAITQAAQELDLGLDSFVLIDDNPAERELVRTEIPKVRLLDPTDAYAWRSLRRLLDFPNTRDTEEARTRTEMYRAQAQRREAQSQAFDYPAMMAALELQAGFGPAARGDLDRVAELVQRTNQFNTTTIRYSKTDLQRMLESDTHRIYVADLADKFGKLGLVGVVILRRDAGTTIVDSFVMSCRAMGFGLERLMLRAALEGEGARTVVTGRFVPTDRNTPASGLFPENGFRQADATSWTLATDDPLPAAPEWIRLVRRG